MRRLAAALLVLTACTAGDGPGVGSPRFPEAAPPPADVSPEPADPVIVPVVTSETGPSSATDGAFLEGMRVAEAEVNEAGGILGRPLELQPVDDAGDPATAASLVASAVATAPPAMFAIGPPSSVADARAEIEAAGVPVFLLGGDLYTPRQLFRLAFQTSVPLRWQARVIAHYLVGDRRYQRVVLLVEAGPLEGPALETFNAAMAEEGSALAAAATIPAGGPGDAFPGVPPLDPAPVLTAAQGAEAVVFVGSAETAAAVSQAVATLPDPPQLALSSEALHETFATGHTPAPGTVVCYPYTWSGWADVLPQVHDFRESFAEQTSHVPAGLYQEGYDAVRAFADALPRTEGRGGHALVTALEGFREQTYSATPILLGPDDHVLAEQSHLGLFAVAAEPPTAPEASAIVPWRPIIRTFTTDGEKVNFADDDKKVFFPFWTLKRPTPKYWRSPWGIVTRPREDPLH